MYVLQFKLIIPLLENEKKNFLGITYLQRGVFDVIIPHWYFFLLHEIMVHLLVFLAELVESLAESVFVAPSTKRALDNNIRLEFQFDFGVADSPVALGEVKVSSDGPGPNVRSGSTIATAPETLVHLI